MLCVIHHNFDDAIDNSDGNYSNWVDNFIKKLLFYLSYDELYVKRGIFWSHNTGFNHNNGHIYGKIYICRNKAIRFGKSHLWHKKYFPPFTKLCGVVTCIVTSKSLVLMLLNFLGVI